MAFFCLAAFFPFPNNKCGRGGKVGSGRDDIGPYMAVRCSGNLHVQTMAHNIHALELWIPSFPAPRAYK